MNPLKIVSQGGVGNSTVSKWRLAMAAICFSAIHPTLSAATSSLTILDFGNAANAVATGKFVEDMRWGQTNYYCISY
jgi:hypothetical protein